MTADTFGRWRLVRSVAGSAVVVADSATWPGILHDAVAVCGSHGSVTAAAYGVRLGAKALAFNDAGIGKDQAGVAGLAFAEERGVAAVAVSHRSARIGDGWDTYREGVVSRHNGAATAAGVVDGMAMRVAADLLAAQPADTRSRASVPPPAPSAPEVLIQDDPSVLAVDSVASVDATMDDAVVVTGSHGGVVGGRALPCPVRAAFFNDAGVGKDDAGIGRLALLDTQGVPAGTVSFDTARIGDARDTFHSGRLSYVNALGAAAGLTVGEALRTAVCAFRAGRGGRVSESRP